MPPGTGAGVAGQDAPPWAKPPVDARLMIPPFPNPVWTAPGELCYHPTARPQIGTV